MRRSRKAKFLLATLGLLLLIQAASFLWWACYRSPMFWCGLVDGRAFACWPGPDPLPPDPNGLTICRRYDSTPWSLQLPMWRPSFLRYNYISIPLWPFILATAGAALWSYRRPQPLPGHCPTCHYNLRDIPPSSSAKVSCPECGNSSTVAPLPTNTEAPHQA